VESGKSKVESGKSKVESGKSKVPNTYHLVPKLWFTEGFDTKDLQEAKALLEILT
jgi:hypothetical protein